MVTRRWLEDRAGTETETETEPWDRALGTGTGPWASPMPYARSRSLTLSPTSPAFALLGTLKNSKRRSKYNHRSKPKKHAFAHTLHRTVENRHVEGGTISFSQLINFFLSAGLRFGGGGPTPEGVACKRINTKS